MPMPMLTCAKTEVADQNSSQSAMSMWRIIFPSVRLPGSACDPRKWIPPAGLKKSLFAGYIRCELGSVRWRTDTNRGSTYTPLRPANSRHLAINTMREVKLTFQLHRVLYEK